MTVFEPLRRQCWRWVGDNLELLRAAIPHTVVALDDRAADNWRPLLQIAEVAAGEWPDKARAAATALGCLDDGLVGVGQQLLADVRQYFVLKGMQAVRSRDLATYLGALEGRPWPDWAGGRAISPNQIARLLADFGVQPKTVRFTAQKNGTDKGYEWTQFEEAFARYLPSEAATPSQSSETRA